MLRSMVNNLINDKSEQASLDLHSYMTAKMKEVSGISSAEHDIIEDDTDVIDEIE